MKELSVKLSNCFGIGSLEHNFSFLKHNLVVIYAPNGVMKTSFAKTFDLVSRGNEKDMPRDIAFDERHAEHKITVDGKVIDPGSIFVANADEIRFNPHERITRFLASKELKGRYDKIYGELNIELTAFMRKLKTTSGSTDCHSELLETFQESLDDTIFTIFENLKEMLNTKHQKYEFKYNDIFDTKKKVRDFVAAFKSDLDDYFKKYTELLQESVLFRKNSSVASFGTYQASELLKSVDDDAFFYAGHKLLLSNNVPLESSAALAGIVKKEIQRILADKNLHDIFDKIDKQITKNVELRAFKSVIERNNLLLLELADYENFKKKTWYGFLYDLKDDYHALMNSYQSKKSELGEIIAEAEKERSQWLNILALFNARFNVPFTVALKNQRNLLLNLEAAELTFNYSDEKEYYTEKNADELRTILSKGELRAFNILNILFEIEARKENQENLIIFDDISDSFDYKNKYAIIEYIQEISESDNFKCILLTHNFDFYRTIGSRFCLRGPSCLMATRDKDRIVRLEEGEYLQNVLTSWFKYGDFDKRKLISIIPFARNISEFTRGNDDSYHKFTCCLHIKNESKGIKVSEVIGYLIALFPIAEAKITQHQSDENIIEFIFTESDKISFEPLPNHIALENKIVLAIAIRLKAEKFMLAKLGESISTPSHNQTLMLFKEFLRTSPPIAEINILRKVNLMTPEHIHVNSFMYEPLIDMSISHLLELYNELGELTKSSHPG